MLCCQSCVVNGVLGWVVLSELACDVTQHADVAAVVMQEGLAHVCLVTPSMTLVRSKIETTIPRKRKGLCSQHDKVSLSQTTFAFSIGDLALCRDPSTRSTRHWDS